MNWFYPGCAVFAATLLEAGHSANAQSNILPESENMIIYDVKVGETGEIELEEVTSDSLQKLRADKMNLMENAGSGILSESGWALINKEGNIESVWTTLDGGQIPAELAEKVELGDTITRVSVVGMLQRALPTDEELGKALEEATNRVVGRFCGMPDNRRPSKVSTSISLGMSFGAEGVMSVGAEWETANLCLP